MCKFSYTCGLSKESGRMKKEHFTWLSTSFICLLYWLYVFIRSLFIIKRVYKIMQFFSHSWKINSVFCFKSNQQHQFPMYYSKVNFVILENSMLLLSHFSRVWLCATPWTAAYKAPPSMGFSRQEYWSGVPLPSPGEQYGGSLKK